MPKNATVFVCQNCGASFPKWSGQCGSCGEWNTLVESLPEKSPVKTKSARNKKFDPSIIVPFSNVGNAETPQQRISTGLVEFDRVLGEDRAGKGMVPGAVILIGGEPGIGKSTLLTQLVVELLSREKPLAGPILYISGEESPAQIALRIRRILQNEHVHIKNDVLNEKLHFVTSTDVDEIVSVITSEQPALLVVDSIQTLATEDLLGASGSVGQLREAAERLIQVVKPLNIPTFLVGHVTKEGTIAGPKVLEHMVDAVLELSGERTGQLRLLRAIKNRFGATDEVGVFQVDEFGLAEVSNPSQLFLEHQTAPQPGSATVCVIEGTRPFLVEVQALVVESQLAMPRRVGRGVQLSRIQVLAAVLQKHCRLPLGNADIFLNVAGGFSVTEPAVDLGLAVAIVSSFRNIPLPIGTVFIGEVGLLGEIRQVGFAERRAKEATRLGFQQVVSRAKYSSLAQVLKAFHLD